MAEQKNQSEELLILIETMILSTFLIIGRVFVTSYYFIVKPGVFAREVLRPDLPGRDFPQRFVRPVTYFFFCLIAYLTTMYYYDKVNNVKETYFIFNVAGYLSEGDVFKMFITVSPFLGLMALYAMSLSIIHRKHFPIFGFTQSFQLICFFFGTFFFLYFALIPVGAIVAEKEKNPIIINTMRLFVIIIMLSMVRCLYSYFVLLRYSLQKSWGGTLLYFLKGAGVFFVILVFVLMWANTFLVKVENFYKHQ